MSLKSLTAQHSVTIHRETETRGVAGSAGFTWPKESSTTCRIQPASAMERQLALQRGTEVTHRIYFSSDPGLEEGDQIQYEGRKFDVESNPTNTDELNRLWVVMARESDQRQ